jgi:hypothetical protein
MTTTTRGTTAVDTAVDAAAAPDAALATVATTRSTRAIVTITKTWRKGRELVVTSVPRVR